MENNIPTLYILELDSFVVKSGKNFSYFMPFRLKNKKKQSCIRVAMVHMRQAKSACVIACLPAFSVEIIRNTSC